MDVVPEGVEVGALSASRGVSIGFLLDFTHKHDAWAWTSWDLILKVMRFCSPDSRVDPLTSLSMSVR